MKNENDLSLKERIELYKQIENDFKEFFSATNFCMDKCITKDKSIYEKNPFHVRPFNTNIP
jgi:hypothetical protein